jgi:5-(aminomethyl)-3-furanmethanol phosphate kinase
MTWTWQRGVIRAAATPPPGRVVKIGGSLLGRPGWPAAINWLVAQWRPTLVVVGGGPVVDGLRAIDAAGRQPAAFMHELAIDAMSLTGRTVAEAIGMPVVAGDAAAEGVLDASAWLRAAGSTAALPAGWQVTSDSIAAAVARVAGLRLVLVKSVAPPGGGGDLAALAAAGWVDPYFPAAAAKLAAIDWAAPDPP